jgi:hypothetical protein
MAALLLGLAYSLCLVLGLRQAEELAEPRDRGAVLSAYYVLAYLGFAMPYAVSAANGALGETGALAALACCGAVLTAWIAVQARYASREAPESGPVRVTADRR